MVYEIHSGFYGDTDLSGTRAAFTAIWPEAIHKGNGQMQLIIDDSASADQKKALEEWAKIKDDNFSTPYKFTRQK